MIALPDSYVMGTMQEVPGRRRQVSLNLGRQVVGAYLTITHDWILTDPYGNSFQVSPGDEAAVDAYAAAHYLQGVGVRISPAAIVWAQYEARVWLIHSVDGREFAFSDDRQTTMRWLTESGLTQIAAATVISLDHTILVSMEDGKLIVCNREGEVTVPPFQISAEHRPQIRSVVAATGWTRREDDVYLNQARYPLGEEVPRCPALSSLP